MAKVLPSIVAIPEVVRRQPETQTALWLGNLSYRSNSNGLFNYLQRGWHPLADRQVGGFVSLDRI